MDERRHPCLDELNAAQRAAVTYGLDGDDRGTATNAAGRLSGPLLVVAGAGTGKTKTLAHRVAYTILGGADPRRILLLTFTRRAAREMTTRARRICAAARAT